METFSDYPSAVLVKREKKNNKNVKRKQKMATPGTPGTSVSGGAEQQLDEVIEEETEEAAEMDISERFKRLSTKEKRKLKRETRKAQSNETL